MMLKWNNEQKRTLNIRKKGTKQAEGIKIKTDQK